MKKLLLFAVALMTLCAVKAQDELAVLYRNAYSAYQSKDYANAAKDFDSFIEKAQASEDFGDDKELQRLVQLAKRYVPYAYYFAAIKAQDNTTKTEYMKKAKEWAENDSNDKLEEEIKERLATQGMYINKSEGTTISASGKGEWKQNCKEFPKGSVVTKVRLKDNGGSGGFWKEVWLEGMNGSIYKINAKKLSVDKVKFKEMDQDADGWRVYTLPVPAVYNWDKDSSYDELCYTNIQFFVDEELTAAENAWVSEIEKETIIAKVRISSKKTYDEKNLDFSATLSDGEGNYATIECDRHMYVGSNGRHSFFGTYNFKSTFFATEETVGKWKVYTFKNPVKLSAMHQSSTDVQFIIDNDAKFVYNPFKVITDKEPAITGPDGTTMHHTTYEHRGGIHDHTYNRLNVSGYLSGDRLYEKKEDGSLRLIRQIVDNLPLPVIEGDSVTGVRVEKRKRYNSDPDLRFHITYASGDSLAFDDQGSDLKYSGRLHRNGAVWTIEENRFKKIEYDNGDVYTGSIYFSPWFNDGLKAFSSHDAWKVRYEDGTLQKKNGESITYRNGKSQMEIEAERKAEERAYRDLCNKYGKKYVDAANEADIIPGMPVELMLSIRWYTFEVCYSTNQVKVYRIRGLGVRGNTFTDKAVQGYAWVSNGRVTKITSYPPM